MLLTAVWAIPCFVSLYLRLFPYIPTPIDRHIYIYYMIRQLLRNLIENANSFLFVFNQKVEQVSYGVDKGKNGFSTSS